MAEILLFQIIAHLLADFYFQPEMWCNGKRDLGFRSSHMYLHVFVVFLFSCLATPDLRFIPFAAGISLLHLLTDGLKSYGEKRFSSNCGKQDRPDYSIFLTDQALHIIVIYAAVYLYYMIISPSQIFSADTSLLLLVIAFLSCMKPANVFVRCLLGTLNLTPGENIPETGCINDQQPDLEKAGRWIGSMERVLSLALVLAGEYTAIGFIIAAKSILRYSDRQLRKTEYVLIGTLASFGISVIIGMAIRYGWAAWLLDAVSI